MMQRNAGSCTSELRFLQRVFNCTALFAGAITAAVLIAVATSSIPGLRAINLTETHLSRLTVVYKNQLRPSMSELEARAPQAVHKGKASGHDWGVFRRQGQWI
jgi:hypothetical protein